MSGYLNIYTISYHFFFFFFFFLRGGGGGGGGSHTSYLLIDTDKSYFNLCQVTDGSL